MSSVQRKKKKKKKAQLKVLPSLKRCSWITGGENCVWLLNCIYILLNVTYGSLICTDTSSVHNTLLQRNPAIVDVWPPRSGVEIGEAKVTQHLHCDAIWQACFSYHVHIYTRSHEYRTLTLTDTESALHQQQPMKPRRCWHVTVRERCC